MSTFHRSLIVEEFRQHGGTLTGPQIAAVAGFGWRRYLHEMRRADYLLVEDAAGLWHLDLEALPELDAGRDGDRDAAEHPPAQSTSVAHAEAVSPDVEPEPLFEAKPAAPNHYEDEVA